MFNVTTYEHGKWVTNGCANGCKVATLSLTALNLVAPCSDLVRSRPIIQDDRTFSCRSCICTSPGCCVLMHFTVLNNPQSQEKLDIWLAPYWWLLVKLYLRAQCLTAESVFHGWNMLKPLETYCKTPWGGPTLLKWATQGFPKQLQHREVQPSNYRKQITDDHKWSQMIIANLITSSQPSSHHPSDPSDPIGPYRTLSDPSLQRWRDLDAGGYPCHAASTASTASTDLHGTL